MLTLKKESVLGVTCLFNFFLYEGCLVSKDTKVLNMYNIFNLQKRHCK
jgi:hypothetical protein